MYKIPVLCSSNAQASSNRTSNYTHMYMYLNTIATFSHQKQNINLKAGSNKSSWQNLKLFSAVIGQPQSHTCTLKMKIIKLNLLRFSVKSTRVLIWQAHGTNFCIYMYTAYFSVHRWQPNESNNYSTWKLSTNSNCSKIFSSTLVLILDLSLKNPFNIIFSPCSLYM